MSIRSRRTPQPSRLVMARSRGAITGPLLMVLGAWGALVPFIGHSFGFGFTPNNTWAWTAARGWLEVLPGAAAFVGGALLTTSAHRISATFGAWIAAASGAWFIVGTLVGPLWSAGNIGVASGTGHHQVYEQLGMFSGLGVVIVLLAAIAIGRVSVVGVRDVSAAQARLDLDSEDSTAETAVRPVRTVRLPETTDTQQQPVA
jgi:MFS family permease